MTPLVADYLRRTSAVPGIGPQTHLSAIKMRSTTREGGALVSLLFLDYEPEPRYVLRVPRYAGRDERRVPFGLCAAADPAILLTAPRAKASSRTRVGVFMLREGCGAAPDPAPLPPCRCNRFQRQDRMKRVQCITQPRLMTIISGLAA